MDDSELVAAALSGDQHAWAAIYDRYTDRIHDFAHATLRDRTEAAEVVQKTFAVAFMRLGQLRQPSRLGPWLFAIAHRAGLERAPGPDDLTAMVPAAPPPPGPATPPAGVPTSRPQPPPASPPEDSSHHELTDIVWQASGALSARERALLDLNVRQGQAGPDLADAVGFTPARLAMMLNRLRAQFERSVGALLVARSSRRDCPRLADILTGWDGVVTPELQDRITGHVDDCETCNSRRRLVLNPLEVLAAIAPTPAPAYLRRVVLSRFAQAAAGGGGAGGRGVGEGGSGLAGWIFDANGFPYQGGDRQVEPAATVAVTTVNPAGGYERPSAYTRFNAPIGPTTAIPRTERFGAPLPGPPGPRDRKGVILGALAGVIILVGGIVALVATRGTNGSGQVAVTPPSTTAAPQTTVTTSPPTTTAPSTTRPPAPTTVPPGHFIVGAKGLDFGATGVAQPLVVGNDGAGPLAFTATAPVAALTIVPASGTIEPGANTTLTVTLDRAKAPPGVFSTTIAISSGAGTAIVAVNAEVDAGPSLTGEQASPDTIKPSGCIIGPGVTRSTVTAQLAAPVPLDHNGARLHSMPPDGSDVMMSLSGSTVTGSLGPYPAVTPIATVEWWITVTDNQGLTAATPHHFISVRC